MVSSNTIEILHNEPLSRHTTWRIGGPAKTLVKVAVTEQGAIQELLREYHAAGERVVIMGGGSNILAPDEGFDGVVLCIKDAPLSFREFVELGIKHGFTSTERLVGIPGTLGGAIAMNAGTATEFIGDLVESVTAIDLTDPDFPIRTYTHDEIEWGYRTTSLRDTHLILAAAFNSGEQEDPATLRVRCAEKLAQRKATQPLNFPNAGSVFRNPDGDSAGRLIEAVELKGMVCGGAQISDVHANFIVNRGGATAADVLELIELARKRVFEEYGVELQTEVRLLGA